MKRQTNNKSQGENINNVILQINQELKDITSADELLEKIFRMMPKINLENLTKAKSIIENYIAYYEALVKAGFKLTHKHNKLLYLPEAMENHDESEVYNRIVNDTFEGFSSWAQRKNIGRQGKMEKRMKEKIPKYIRELIEQGYIGPDGKTVMGSLEAIAEFLLTKIEEVTPQLLINSFVKKDGTKYSLRTAQDAIQRSKT